MGVCLPVKMIVSVPLTSANHIENLDDLDKILKTQLIFLHLLVLKTQKEFKISLMKNNNFSAVFHKFREDSLYDALDTIRDFLTEIDPLNQPSMENEDIKNLLRKGKSMTKFFSKGIFTTDFEVGLGDMSNLKVILKKVYKVDGKYFKELEDIVEADRKKCQDDRVGGYIRTRYIKGMSEKIKLS